MIAIEFRRFLIWLRKQKSILDRKYILYCVVGIVSLSIVSIIVDKFVPWNFVFNLFRGVLSIFLAFISFSLCYYFIKDEDNGERSSLSYKQRVNLSIIIFFFVVLLNIAVLPPGSEFYTFFSSIVLMIGLILLFYSKPTRLEYLRDKYEIEDEREMIEKIKNKEKRS